MTLISWILWVCAVLLILAIAVYERLVRRENERLRAIEQRAREMAESPRPEDLFRPITTADEAVRRAVAYILTGTES